MSRSLPTHHVHPVPGARRALAPIAGSALLAASLVLGTGAVPAFAADHAGPDFAPADAFAYLDLDLELAGSQADNLAGFLATIPGMEGMSPADLGIGALLGGMTGSDGAEGWSTLIEPWFDGEIRASIPDLPPMNADVTADPTAAAGDANVVAALGVKDAAALDATFPALIDSAGATSIGEHAGVEIFEATAESDGSTTLVAATDTAVLISNDQATLEEALDVLAGSIPSLAADEAFLAAESTLPAERIGSFVLATAGLAEQVRAQAEAQAQSDPTAAALLPEILAQVGNGPDHVTGAIVAEPGHLTARIAFKTPADAPMALAVRETDLAQHVPADVAVFLEARDLGTLIGLAVDQAGPALTGEDPMDPSGSMAQIEALLGAPLDEFLSWLGDTAVGVSLDGDAPSFGLVGQVSDEALAEQRIIGLVGLIRMIAASGEESPIVVEDSTIGDVAVTTFTLTEASGMTEGLPIEPSLSIALGNGHFWLGVGGFVESSLALDPAASLAEDPSYVAAIESAGGADGGRLWLDIPSVAGLAMLTMSSDEAAQMEAQLGPVLDSLGPVLANLDQDGDVSSASLMLFAQ